MENCNHTIMNGTKGPNAASENNTYFQRIKNIVKVKMQYKCLSCNKFFNGLENEVCPNCSENKVVKVVDGFMKQEINTEQWEQLSEQQQECLMIGMDKKEIKKQSKYWTIGKSIEFIRHHHQLDICTTNDRWFVYLYDLSDCAQCACDEGISCIYENDEEKLIDALFEAVVWILDRLMDS